MKKNGCLGRVAGGKGRSDLEFGLGRTPFKMPKGVPLLEGACT